MIIKKEKPDFINYLEDTSNVLGNASILYLPEDKEEVRDAIEECKKRHIPFTLSGGRTGTTAGCVPNEGAILSLERLDKIINIDQQNKTARVASGVSLEALANAANKHNLTLRASPTESLAFIGGAISTSASGVRGFSYGGIRNYIQEIEVLLLSGKIINIKRGQIHSFKRKFDFEKKGIRFNFNIPSYNLPSVKSQAGYFVHDKMDLIDLFIGSEGTLGIILSCLLQLQDMPFSIFDGLIFFKKEEDIFHFISMIKDLKKKRKLNPAALEFFDKNSLDMLRGHYNFIPSNCLGVYFEQEANSQDESDKLLEKWQVLMDESGAILDKAIIADTPKEREKLFDFRHKLPQLINEYLRITNQPKASSDISVPQDKFFEMYKFYKEIAKERNIDFVNFGHIGEDHLHFNFLPKNDFESKKAKEALFLFCEKAVSLGGTVSSEHGIGKIKKPYLKIMYSKKHIEEMVNLKRYFDPQGLMNQDNVFDKELIK